MSVERGEAVRDARRDEHAAVVVRAVGALTEIEHLGGAVGGRARAQVVQHDAGACRTARTSSRPGAGGSAARRSHPAARSPRLPWIISRPLREPLAAVRLDEEAALVAVDRRARRWKTPAMTSALGDGLPSLLQHRHAGVVAEHQPRRLRALRRCARPRPPGR